jgi:Xaa-Pro aminopeptidase
MDHLARIRGLQAALAGSRLDLLLVTHLPNIRYLCGFTGSSAALLILDHTAVLFTDGRYTEQARSEVKGANIVIVRKAALSAAGEWLRGKSRLAATRPNLGIEGEHMSVAGRARLTDSLGGKFRIKLAPALVETARMVKDANEIGAIRRAVTLGASLFETTLKVTGPGVKELDVAAEMEYAAMRAGAERMSFETIIASGPRSALPHGRASHAAISRGFVVCDFGVILDGYCSDMTRTLYVGRVSREARDLYESVREAQQAGTETVRAGIVAEEIDRQARNVLKKAGLGRFFTHSTGHGVGLEIHEAPRVASGQKDVLKSGMVITIEPGAYVPGKWGVRIEDMVVVTETGCEVLTPTSKELVII